MNHEVWPQWGDLRKGCTPGRLSTPDGWYFKGIRTLNLHLDFISQIKTLPPKKFSLETPLEIKVKFNLVSSSIFVEINLNKVW
ncbi:hypothetical protein MTR_0030s0050 [Medicago truncatula]|uniref:Uncharacterized protein n=1 Tax=Medicago truncatula TaxID=3880 RepID=G7ZUG1_MEDTR|nr:hypothetical protein MTR_0030s0050 [Medicago truncatula]